LAITLLDIKTKKTFVKKEFLKALWAFLEMAKQTCLPTQAGQKHEPCDCTALLKNKKACPIEQAFYKKRQRVEGYSRQRCTNKKKPQSFQIGVH
jgi:hypothetical protein